MAESENALALDWVFSFNEKTLGGVHSLCTDQRNALFYAAAHTGVIYDYGTRTQLLLQGHRNVITCCAVSKDKRWIVTADSGPDSLLAVWDSVSGTPIKTIFNPHPSGVQSLDISSDSLYIVTLGHVEDDSAERQQIGIWGWAEEGREEAIHLEAIPGHQLQECARFNMANPGEIVTNGASQVIFWDWNETTLTLYSPRMSKKELHHTAAHLTVSSFVEGSSSSLAVTGTTDGRVIMWDMPYLAASAGSYHDTPQPRHQQRSFVKSIQLSQGKINHLSSVSGKYICVSGEDGAVRFYDFQFRIEGWFEDLNAGPVASVSFSAQHPKQQQQPQQQQQQQQQGNHQKAPSQHGNSSLALPGAADEEDTFRVPDFVVGTEMGYVVGVQSHFFEEIDAENRRGTLLVQGLNDEVSGIAAHPTMPRLAISSHNGSIQLWDYDKKVLLMLRSFEKPKLRPHTVTFDPSGHFLLVGFVTGQLKILDAETLGDVMTSETSEQVVTMIRFSVDGRYFAVADGDGHVGLWSLKLDLTRTGPDANDTNNMSRSTPARHGRRSHHSERAWSYVGRRKSHSRRITGLEFVRRENGRDALVSVGEDRRLVEYDLANSSVEHGLMLVSEPHKIEQASLPSTCMWYPRLAGEYEDRVITANTDLKFKQWNADNVSCRFTTLAPSFGGAVTRLISMPSPSHVKGVSIQSQYVAYATTSQVIGLLKLPLDGSPDKWMGLIAHPTAVSCIAVAKDGAYVFSAGGSDRTVNMWRVNTGALDATEAVGAGGMAPYLRLLEGGADGPLHQELRDYFYYTQLRIQGEDTTCERVTSGQIPVSEIPVMMRALGFFPTELEVDCMINEVRYRDFTQTGETVEFLDLDTFTKLYINHRPAYPLDRLDIEKAFLALGATRDGSLSTTKLVKALESMGEPISKAELKAVLSTLTGEGSLKATPTISTAQFATDVLGFEDEEEEAVGREHSRMGEAVSSILH